MSILVTLSYTLAAGQTIDLTADTDYYFNNFRPGYIFHPGSGVIASFTIAGSATISGSKGDIAGLFVEYATSDDVFHIVAGGSFSTVSTNKNADSLTFGVYSPFWTIKFVNDGAFNVQANQTAIGFYSANQNNPAPPSSFDNNGTMTVTSTKGQAIGVEVTAGIPTHFGNSGILSVHGATSAIAVYDIAGRLDSFSNSGAISATTDLATGSSSIALLVNGPGNGFTPAGSFVNAGSMTGDFAVLVRETWPHRDFLYNTGELDGIVELARDDDRLLNGGGITGDVRLSEGNDLYVALDGALYGAVEGGNGDDWLAGGTNGHVLLGGLGNDRISGGSGDDFIDGGRNADALDGGAGFDTLSYVETATGIVANLVKGTVRSDAVDNVSGFEALLGSSYDDKVIGIGKAETFEGLAGDDILSGRNGNDTLIGGTGDDTLTGGRGKDTFVFTLGDGADTITDFEWIKAHDKLAIHGYSTYQQLVQNGADVDVVLSATDRIKLLGVDLASLTPASFLFSTDVLPPEPARSQVQGQMQIDRDTHILAGESYDIVDPGVGYFYKPYVYDEGLILQNIAHLFNDGMIRIEAHTPADTTISLNGVIGQDTATRYDIGQSSDNRYIVNAGTIEVINHGGSSDPHGINTTGMIDSNLVRFWNDGEFLVSAERGGVTGFVGSGLVNRGDITVTSLTGGALGVAAERLTIGPSFYLPDGAWNLGSIDVIGVLASVGVRVELDILAHSFANAGTISVSDETSAQDSSAIEIHTGTVFNSGTATADYAITALGNRPIVYNSGTLDGDILFGHGASILRNTGLIDGEVRLCETDLSGTDDIFDSRGGTVTGTVFARSGDDFIYMGTGSDTVDGGDGSDTISGGGGDDMLSGGTGNDAFFQTSGDGDDVITDFVAGLTGDVIRTTFAGYSSIQQQGSDTLVRFTAHNSILLVNVTAASLTAANFQFGANALPDAPAIPSAPDAPLSPKASTMPPDLDPGFLKVFRGTVGDDVLVGTKKADLFIGGAGNDAYAVDHTGDDIAELPGEGTDTANVTASTYVLPEMVERLVLLGKALNGTGNQADNELVGNALGNTLDGGDGDDTISGGAGNDVLTGAAGDDTLMGGDGNDMLDGGRGHNVLDGGAGDDDLRAADPGIIHGGDGNDTVHGYNANGYSNNTVYGDAGDDTLEGGLGSDTLYGGDGSDTIAGGDGIDTLSGDGGDDVLNTGYGSNGHEILDGGDGNDILISMSAGTDVIGGAGADILRGSGGLDDSTIVEFMDFSQAEGDRIDFSGSNVAFIGTAAFTTGNQVRYYVQDGNTIVDRHYEFGGDSYIKLDGLFTLTAADFIL